MYKDTFRIYLRESLLTGCKSEASVANKGWKMVASTLKFKILEPSSGSIVIGANQCVTGSQSWVVPTGYSGVWLWEFVLVGQTGSLVIPEIL
jgi:hypothetical protein